MLDILQNTIFNNQKNDMKEDVVFIFPLYFSKTIKFCSLIKKSYSLNKLGCRFLIDGAKFNSKKDLQGALFKLNDISSKHIDTRSPFLVIVVINIKYITIETQILFKNFLQEKAMSMKFFFLTEDLESLNEIFLFRGRFISCSNSIFVHTELEKKKQNSLLKIANYINKKKKKICSRNDDTFRFLLYSDKEVGKFFISINKVFFEFQKKISNEFLLLFFKLSFKFSLNSKITISPNFFRKFRDHFKIYRLYQTVSINLLV